MTLTAAATQNEERAPAEISNGNGDRPPAIPDYLLSPDAVFGDKGIKWRYGKPPDYSKTRQFWLEGKTANHVAGSLPEMVENLVKNWEVEASFKPRLQDWRTIDHANYSFAMNGAAPQTAEHMLSVGTYNAIIATANEYYDPTSSDFAGSHKTFKRMMPTFAWEVLEVYSGPPTVAFRWRHWGQMKNDYVAVNGNGDKVTAKAHGGLIEIFGVTVAKVDDQVRMQSVETWMDPLALFRQIAPEGVAVKEVFNGPIEGIEHLAVKSPVESKDTNGAPDGHLFDYADMAAEDGFEMGKCPFIHSPKDKVAKGPQSDEPNGMNGKVTHLEAPVQHQMPLPIESLVPEVLPPTTIPQSFHHPMTVRSNPGEHRNAKAGIKNPARVPADESERMNGQKRLKLKIETELSAGQDEMDDVGQQIMNGGPVQSYCDVGEEIDRQA